jgi:hypothetical protein
MRKGEKYQKKIDKATLIKLRKEKKTGKEIADYFHCSPVAVNKTVIRYGLQRRKPDSIRKGKKTNLQIKIFNEVNAHVTTAQGMINELSVAISDNVSIKESIKQKIKEAKRSNVIKEEIDRFFEAQDRVVQRMKDYRELQKDLIGIAELQKFVFAIIEAYKTLPIEYRIIFQNELKKRDIVHLTVEQLVEPIESSEEHVKSGNDKRGERPLPATAAESNNNSSPNG